MASTFKDITVNGIATQTGAPTLANHLVRLSDVQAMLGALVSGNIKTGTVTGILTGATGGQVTGLGLTFTPAQVYLTVSNPAGGLGLTAEAEGVPTVDGFTWRFTNGVPDTTGYKVFYLLLP